LFCVLLSSAVQCYFKVRILDRTGHLCVKTVQIQDYCGGSDQSKLRATSLSGLVCLLCFIVVNHRHLPISRRSLKQNTENLPSKILYQPSPNAIKEVSTNSQSSLEEENASFVANCVGGCVSIFQI